MPTCLTSWAIEEFETVPRKYVAKEPGCYAPRFTELLEILKPKMQEYRSQKLHGLNLKLLNNGKMKT